jgi:hypothetical protein
MSRTRPDATGLELVVGGTTVLLSTLSYLLGSTTLSLLALVIGSISFGMLVGARKRDWAPLGTSATFTGSQRDEAPPGTEPKSASNPGASTSGSDGTRTRDLRRDRPAL